jgi:hypothetical protein
MAYQIVEGEGQGTITLPESQPTIENQSTENQAGGSEEENPGEQPNTPEPNVLENDNVPATNEGEDSGFGSGLCASAVVAPLLLIGLVVTLKQRKPTAKGR